MDLFDVEKLNDFKNDGKSFIGLSRRIRVNPLIAEYYVRLGDDYNDLVVTRGEDCVDFPFKMNRRANRILNCGRMIESKRWKTLGVHEVSSLKRCGDKFCGNCQKLLANTREHKYTPLLNELNKKYDLYHIALTVPNVAGDKLPGTVGNIIKAFGKMIKYFLGRKKIRGLNLMNFGCVGAIRSMEITMNRTMTTYHPHLHCIFVFPKGLALDEPKVFANAFSYHAKRENDFQARRAQCANSRGGSVAANLVTPSVSENYSISWARGYRDSHSPHFIGAEARAKEYAADLKQAKREYYVQSAAKRGYCNGVKAGLATRKK